MRVLIGVDDSPFSDAAVRYVSEAVWPKRTHFIVLSAAGPLYLGPVETLAPQAITELIEQHGEYHMKIAERAAVRLREAGLTTEARMVRADPRVALEETARTQRVDLIVVGSHGRSGIKKLILGSVASHVITHAPCTVVVVKTPSLSTRGTEQGGADASKSLAAMI